MTKYNYETEILIDQNKLDEAWLDQPRLVMKYGMALADARSEEDESKESLGLIKARAEIRYRRIMNDNGEKVTEPLIKASVAKDKGVLAATEKWLQCVRSVRVLEVAVKSFDQRKSALENLVKLFGMQYFAEPTADIMSRGAAPSKGTARMKRTAEKIRRRKNERNDQE